jgi:hypothetical protein
MAVPDLLERIRALLPEVAIRRDLAEHEARRRWLAALMALVVAFVLWFTFSMRESYLVVVEVPLVVDRLPEGRALGQAPPERARVTVQGEGWELLKLRRRPPDLAIGATDERVDVYAAASESNRFPPGVSVQSVIPSSIVLDLEPRITRTVPVRVRTQLATAELYDFLGTPTVEPDTVQVSGARSIVNTLQYWPTVPVVREDVNRSFTAAVPLADTLRGLVATSVSQVRVSVPVALFTEATRELEVRTEGAPPGTDPIRLIPSRVTATYRIPVDQFDRSRETEAFYAFVPYDVALGDTSGTVQPLLHLPEELYVRDARVEPRRLQYRIRVE